MTYPPLYKTATREVKQIWEVQLDTSQPKHSLVEFYLMTKITTLMAGQEYSLNIAMAQDIKDPILHQFHTKELTFISKVKILKSHNSIPSINLIRYLQIKLLIWF